MTLLPASIGLTLVFDGRSQVLVEIGLPTLAPSLLGPPAGLTLTTVGGDILLGSGADSFTKRDVARIFGPTFSAFSGRATDDAELEVWYPGLGFSFGSTHTEGCERDVCHRIWVCDQARRPAVSRSTDDLAAEKGPLPTELRRPGKLEKAIISVSHAQVALATALPRSEETLTIESYR